MSASKTKTTLASDSSSELNASNSYEQAFKELEQIVAHMESGQMSLQDSLAAYKRGNLLLEHCQKSLAEVEQQVKILNERQQLASFNANHE